MPDQMTLRHEWMAPEEMALTKFDYDRIMGLRTRPLGDNFIHMHPNTNGRDDD